MPPDILAVVAPVLQQQPPQQPSVSTVLQAIWIGLAIVFVFSAFAAGFTAKRIENLHNPTYAKAVVATALKNITGLAGFFIFGIFLQAPVAVVLGVALAVIPIIIYKIVFSAAMWREAALIWFVAALVETGVGYVLILVGLVSWSVLTGGAGS